MSSLSLPVLLEDRSRHDWRNASYDPEVRVAPTRATIRHKLRGAQTLRRLVDDGKARWATELRCPKTLYCIVHEAAAPVHTVEWARDDVDGDMFVIPGLVAAADFDLKPELEELALIWPRSPLKVARGWWLARGVARRTRTLGQSLLKFHVDEKLPDGQMSVRRDESDGDLRFQVSLADNVWAERTNRHVQLAALIGALGQMKDAFPDPDDEPLVAQELRRRLEDAGVAAWDGDDYDPARAATVIEPFKPSVDVRTEG